MGSETIRLDTLCCRIQSFHHMIPDDTDSMWAHLDQQACPTPELRVPTEIQRQQVIWDLLTQLFSFFLAGSTASWWFRLPPPLFRPADLLLRFGVGDSLS